MKAFIIALLLLLSPQYDSLQSGFLGTYRLRPAEVVPSTARSCGAARRLMHDRYVMHARANGTVTMSGVGWDVHFAVPGFLWIRKGEPGDRTMYELWLSMYISPADYSNYVDGVFTIWGTVDGKRCVDSIELRGKRE